VILAGGISDISLYNVSNYMAMIMHDRTSLIRVSLAE